jgi:hypothetical protein
VFGDSNGAVPTRLALHANFTKHDKSTTGGTTSTTSSVTDIATS